MKITPVGHKRRRQCANSIDLFCQAFASPVSGTALLQKAFVGLSDDDVNHDCRNNRLVTVGYPLELSAAFCEADEVELRICTEPLAHKDFGSRLADLRGRLLATELVDRACMESFDKIAGVLQKKLLGPAVWWWCHVGAGIRVDSQRISLKVYFSPSRRPTQMRAEDLSNEHRSIVVDDDYAREVWDRVLTLLNSFGMEAHAQELERVRESLRVVEDRGPYVTFVGVNLEVNKPVGFKIYINPYVP